MKIGFLINPIAGMGGSVALKGTDNLAQEAIKLGAKPVSPIRADSFFQTLHLVGDSEFKENLLFLVPQDPMGEQIIKHYSFKYEITQKSTTKDITTAEDTKKAVKLFESKKVDLIIFVGGDGTSVDIGTAILQDTPMLGIPSGVKTYGSVFSHSPEEAVVILQSFYNNKKVNTAELLDLDENQYKMGIISISLKGLVFVPAVPEFFQNAKERVESSSSELFALEGIAKEILDILSEKKGKKIVIIGPGSTFNPFAAMLQINRSVLGVDVIEFSESENCKIIIGDAREDQIFEIMKASNTVFLLLTPIGGMGYLLGRGNHQLSPRILKKIPKENILIACSNQKLQTIKDQLLRVDTIDKSFNQSMRGFIRVITNHGEMKMIKVIH